MTIALALGGGAALGWAHIGVLRALHRHGVPIGAVAGTSIGALAAVCQAADRLDVLEDIARSARLRTVLRYLDPHFRRGAMLGGRTIARQLDRHLGHASFEQLALPCAVVAADLVTGDAVVLNTGNVAEAVRASMALPGIFHPVIRDGRVLVDGGVIMPVPVEAVRSLAPRLPVVAINLQNDYARRALAVGLRMDPKPALTSLSVLRSATGLMLSRLARQSLALHPPELELPLQVGHIDVRHFTRANELIEIGSHAIDEAMPAIRALSEASD
ncbi:patatin [Tardibacter chloracetimidivorans]|uniref:Patatin n=1 Tax=Tardibacter chloracetimidivorans TaxID=1921510 RepID=A0A1L3ZWQ0_9SPHN|nr:patatin-like phospholipase family protein [Tardibacter chloracetimidivorans]API60066.1 patatin [Tardibacter chloracetimidivorans]